MGTLQLTGYHLSLLNHVYRAASLILVVVAYEAYQLIPREVVSDHGVFKLKQQEPGD